MLKCLIALEEGRMALPHTVSTRTCSTGMAAKEERALSMSGLVEPVTLDR